MAWYHDELYFSHVNTKALSLSVKYRSIPVLMVVFYSFWLKKISFVLPFTWLKKCYKNILHYHDL